MTEVVMLGFQAVLLAIFVFLYSRLENRIESRIDSLAKDVSELRTRDLPALRNEMHAESQALRKDLAEEFRAQRAEAAAQIAAIATAISASRP